jgi:citrate synthase
MSEKKPSGLEDVVVAQSSICYIDGRRGQLVYRGYDIDDLVKHSNFEEVAWLLWHGCLPTRAQLDALHAELSAARELPPALIDYLGRLAKAAPENVSVMRILELATATLGVFDSESDNMCEEANRRKAMRLTAQLPIIITTWHRLRQGLPVLKPRPDKSLAYNFLWTLHGKEPDDYAVDTFDTALMLHADHELNASTFSARVTGATLSDLHSAVVAAIATLKGPLHGGANEAVMKMLTEIGEPENVPAYMEQLMAKKQKVMGFGHRVYKAKDPRAKILEKMSQELGKRMNDTKWFEMSVAVEAIFQPKVAAKGIYPNVDFFSASAYHVMGIPTDLFTPIFAASRVVGWTAHLLEQYANNRIFRPSSEYVGPQHLQYQNIENRKQECG